MTQTQRILVWMVVAVLAAVVTYVSFKGYLSPELLINFSHSFYC